MKGITHFALGIAAASFFPAAVRAGAGGDPLYFILGGIAGLLPDTIDFKFARFFSRHDLEVVPDPLAPDAALVAGAVARAANEAHVAGRPVTIRLHTIRVGPDEWQRYTVRFDVARQQVSAWLGPVVTTGGCVVREGAGGRSEHAPLLCELRLDYRAETAVDVLEGPSFRMEPDAGRVVPRFIPWHRRWSHGLPFAAGLAAAAWLGLGPLAGGVVLAASLTHILADQLGFLGSGLLAPFLRRRVEGLKLACSGEPLPNLLGVWFSCLVIAWNLYAQSGLHVAGLNPVRLFVVGAGIPLAAWLLLRRQFSRPPGGCGYNGRRKEQV